MNTSKYRRISRLAGLLFLSSLVFAMGVQAAQAAVVASDGGASSSASFTAATQLQGLSAAAQARHHGTTVAVMPGAASALAVTQGRGGFDQAAFMRYQAQALTAAKSHHYIGGDRNGRFQPASNVLAAQPASPGASSYRSAWIVAGSAAAIVLVGFTAWALMRRRRQPGARASATYCAQHPEDAQCAAA